MKRITAIIIAAILLVSMSGVAAFLSEAPPPENFVIPQAPDGFDIGDFTEAKWTGALVRILSPANCWSPGGHEGDGLQSATFYFLWSDAGVFFRVDVNKPYALNISAPEFDSPYNRGNGIQFFPAKDDTNDLPGWTFHPHTLPNGTPDVWRHWPDEDRDTAARIYIQENANNYIMEGLMPASGWANSGNGSGGISMAAGTSFGLPIVVLMAPAEGDHHIFTDTGWFQSHEYNQYTLSADKAAGAPVAVEEEAPADDAGTPEPQAQPEQRAAAAPVTADPVTLIIIRCRNSCFKKEKINRTNSSNIN
jgi:hypothetical protein